MEEILQDQFTEAVAKKLHPTGLVWWRPTLDNQTMIMQYELWGHGVALQVTRRIVEDCFIKDPTAWDAYGMDVWNAMVINLLMCVDKVPEHRIPDAVGKLVLSPRGEDIVSMIAEKLARGLGIPHPGIEPVQTEPPEYYDDD